MPDCPLVRCRLGSVMLQTGNVNSAAASFTVGWDLAGPHSPSRQQCGGDASLHRSMLALDQPSPCLCMSTRETAVCWNNAGVASLTLGYVEDGVHFLNEALRLQPALQEALMVSCPLAMSCMFQSILLVFSCRIWRCHWKSWSLIV